MLKFKHLAGFCLLLTLVSVGCLHITEEATFRNNGSGSYKMTLDMGEMKNMMDMFKNMKPDSAGNDMGMPDLGGGNPMGSLSGELTGMSKNLKGLQGLTNVVEINDTVNFKFGYSFDFADVNALNRALKMVNKDKFENNAEEVFKFSGKSFERLGSGDLGQAIKGAMGEGEEGGDEMAQGMEMAKMFFADMSYTQIYHFPDRKVKKSTNTLSEMSDDNHTLQIKIKPFDEDQQKKKVTVATAVKLK